MMGGCCCSDVPSCAAACLPHASDQNSAVSSSLSSSLTSTRTSSSSSSRRTSLNSSRTCVYAESQQGMDGGCVSEWGRGGREG